MRATLALLGLLAVLGAAAFAVQGPCSAQRPREHASLLPAFEPPSVALVSVKRGGSEVLLTRGGGGWKLGAAEDPAEGPAVDALLADLADTRVGAVVSTNAARQAAYETDAERGTAVRIEAAGGKVLAAFVIGKRGPDFASCYLRREGSTEVLLVTRDLRTAFARPAESWRQQPKKVEPAAK